MVKIQFFFIFTIFIFSEGMQATELPICDGKLQTVEVEYVDKTSSNSAGAYQNNTLSFSCISQEIDLSIQYENLGGVSYASTNLRVLSNKKATYTKTKISQNCTNYTTSCGVQSHKVEFGIRELENIHTLFIHSYNQIKISRDNAGELLVTCNQINHKIFDGPDECIVTIKNIRGRSSWRSILAS